MNNSKFSWLKFNVSAVSLIFLLVLIDSQSSFATTAHVKQNENDILAQYIGMIQEKVYKNWKNPLGQDHNKLVIFSINIYRKGNIDRPELQKSSRVELLDNLALRAILESEPFPPFPKELNSSNLNISIQFKYTLHGPGGKKHEKEKVKATIKKNKEIQKTNLDKILEEIIEKKKRAKEIVENRKIKRIEKAQGKLRSAEEKFQNTKTLLNKLQTDLKKYFEITESEYGKDLKKQAWEALIILYPGLATGVEEDSPELLLEKAQEKFFDTKKNMESEQELFERIKSGEVFKKDNSKTHEIYLGGESIEILPGLGPIYYPKGTTKEILAKYELSKPNNDMEGNAKNILPTQNRWQEEGFGTAIDSQTGLMWMTKDFRNIEGRAPKNWTEIREWVEKMNFRTFGGHSGWRLPRIDELRSIYDPSRKKLAFTKKKEIGYPSIFEDGGGYWCWSSEEFNSDLVKAFGFYSGTTAVANKNNSYLFSSVRLVRPTD